MSAPTVDEIDRAGAAARENIEWVTSFPEREWKRRFEELPYSDQHVITLYRQLLAKPSQGEPAGDWPSELEAAKRVGAIALGAAGKHAERVLELEAEVSTLREHLAEQNRLLSLNVAEVERLRSAHETEELQDWKAAYNRVATAARAVTAELYKVGDATGWDDGDETDRVYSWAEMRPLADALDADIHQSRLAVTTEAK